MKYQKKTSIHEKYFQGMFLTSSCVIIILLITTCTIFFNHFKSIEINASLNQLNYISQQLDFFIESVDNYSKALIIDDSVQDALNIYNKSPDTFNYNRELSVKDQINKVIQSTEFIHSVCLYGLDKKKIVTTEIYEQKTSSNEGHFELPLFTWQMRTKVSQSNGTEVIPVFSMIRPFYSFSSGAQVGFLEMSIPVSSITNIYQNNVNPTNSIFIITADGLVMSSPHSSTLNTYYTDTPNLSKEGGSSHQYLHNNIVLTKYVKPLDWYIVNEINLSAFLQTTYKMIGIALLIGLVCIIFCIIISYKVSQSITASIHDLVDHTKRIRAGNWIPVEVDYSDREIGYLFEEFNTMLHAQRKLKDDLVESQKMKDKISLELLQQQVNPHFLYNTLDNICSLAELDEKETLIDIVMNLSTFYRQTLSNGKSIITLNEELEITSSYLHILQIRYYNKFDFSIICPPHLGDIRCLKLLLQPIVENSIYHGIKEMAHKGLIVITIKEEETAIIIIVEDNGIGVTKERCLEVWSNKTNRFGVRNIDQRIKLYYGEHYGIQLENNTLGGCTVTLRIGKAELS